MVRSCFLGFLLSLAIAGCTSVEINKVPSKTQYSTWSDEKQAQADSMKGLRFYLPRPYVHVYEPFVVSAKTYVVHGQVTPDGQYVLLSKPKLNSPLHGIIQSVAPDGRMPTALIRIPSGGEQGIEEKPVGTPQDGGDDGTGNDKEKGSGSSKVKAKTGVKKFKSTNDNSAIAITPMRRYFDVVFLMDFDEQYVVQEKGFLGNSDAEINLGQGWSLQSMHAISDNSELNKRLFGIIDFAAETAKKAGLSALGLPTPAIGALPVATTEGGEQGALEGIKPTLPQRAQGRPISLVLTMAEYATPGLYPIMKRREMMEAQVDAKTYKTDANATLAIDPYQHISFNVFRYVVIEPIRVNAVGVPPKAPVSFNSNFMPAVTDECQSKTLLTRIEDFINRDLNQDNHATRAWMIDDLDCRNKTARLIWKREGVMPQISEQRASDIVNDVWRYTGMSGRLTVSFIKKPGQGEANPSPTAPADPTPPAAGTPAAQVSPVPGATAEPATQPS